MNQQVSPMTNMVSAPVTGTSIGFSQPAGQMGFNQSQPVMGFSQPSLQAQASGVVGSVPQQSSQIPATQGMFVCFGGS